MSEVEIEALEDEIADLTKDLEEANRNIEDLEAQVRIYREALDDIRVNAAEVLR